MFHAEVHSGVGGTILITPFQVAGPIDNAAASLHSHDQSEYSTFLASRPKEAENEAIELVARLAKEYNVDSHIVHLSSADALPIIKKAQADGTPLSIETTFHYLHLTAESVPHGRTDFKCCPPIRENSNREQLWQGLKDGAIGLIVSDHSPCTADLKRLQEGNTSHIHDFQWRDSCYNSELLNQQRHASF